MKYLLLSSALILSSVTGGYPTEFANQGADLDLEELLPPLMYADMAD